MCALFILFAALFSAVENGHLEKARTILESTDVDVNRYCDCDSNPLEMTRCGGHKLNHFFSFIYIYFFHDD